MALFTKADIARVRIKGAAINESATESLKKQAAAFSEAKTYDIFLSHSFSDATEIRKIKQLLEDYGYEVYVDWIEDPHLDRSKVTKQTAQRIRTRMCCCRSLFFATSSNSSNSKWMPWELGFSDAFSGKVAIMPILDNPAYHDRYDGQEYLGLYPYVSGDNQGLWIHESERDKKRYRDWIIAQRRLPKKF